MVCMIHSFYGLYDLFLYYGLGGVLQRLSEKTERDIAVAAIRDWSRTTLSQITIYSTDLRIWAYGFAISVPTLLCNVRGRPSADLGVRQLRHVALPVAGFQL